jgi:hypothetical protein
MALSGGKKLLDRLAPVTGLDRNYLAAERPERKCGGSPVKYGEEFAKVMGKIGDEYG